MVETIVSMKQKKYNYPGVDPEDLAQDIRLLCFEAIEEKYDPSKVGKSVFHFVARHVDNRLYNKFRGVYLDNNPPCLRCPEYNKKEKSCNIDEVGCSRIVQYRDRMARRRAIDAPLSYHSRPQDDENDDFLNNESLSVGSLTGVLDLDETLRASIDPDLLDAYTLMSNGSSDQVPAHIRQKVQDSVREILKHYAGGNE